MTKDQVAGENRKVLAKYTNWEVNALSLHVLVLPVPRLSRKWFALFNTAGGAIDLAGHGRA